ncbi:YaiI/YqxD family protein [Fulvimarina sp. MAC8]|uniref:YaiI/YqxD family protein n=1 Tax=Fulvimarina sp. MAC8 TaxID=3162874 RepID=UPI0032ED844D
MPNSDLKVLIDADACPVKDEAIDIACRYGAQPILVSNGGMRPSRFPDARIVTVASGPDAADDWIVEAADETSLVITTDIPLAARALEKGAHALRPTGHPFTQESIGEALAMRSFSEHLRETGVSKGYNAAFTGADRSRFMSAMDVLMRRLPRG